MADLSAQLRNEREFNKLASARLVKDIEHVLVLLNEERDEYAEATAYLEAALMLAEELGNG